MAIKIQINSLDALERLIGGDTDLEIQVRNSVVQEFTTKHLKALATNQLLQKTSQAVIKEVQSTFLTEVKGQYGRTDFVLSNDMRKMLNEHTEQAVKDKCTLLIYDLIRKHTKVAELEKQITSAADRIADRITDTILTKRIDELVNLQIKEKMGL